MRRDSESKADALASAPEESTLGHDARRCQLTALECWTRPSQHMAVITAMANVLGVLTDTGIRRVSRISRDTRRVTVLSIGLRVRKR